MEQFKRISQMVHLITESIQRDENKGIFGITTCGAIVCSWNLSSVHIPDLWLKAIAGIFTIVLGPPIGVFMKDVYIIKVKPRIFKNKKY